MIQASPLARVDQARQLLAEARTVSFDGRRSLPRISGVYWVERSGEVLYVGMATNLRKRWANHHRASQLQRLGADVVRWIPVDSEALMEWESLVIAVFHPVLNGAELRARHEPTPREEAFMVALWGGDITTIFGCIGMEH